MIGGGIKYWQIFEVKGEIHSPHLTTLVAFDFTARLSDAVAALHFAELSHSNTPARSDCFIFFITSAAVFRLKSMFQNFVVDGIKSRIR